MTLTKRRKILLGACALAVAAFAADRLFLGDSTGPAEAEAAVAAHPTRTASGHSSVAAAPAQAQGPAVVNQRTIIARRLERLADSVPPGAPVRDAFCPSPAWVGAVRQEGGAGSNEAKARQSAQRHQLTATFVGTGDGKAIIDGRCVAVGQSIDGLTLVSVEQGSAVLSCDGAEVVLKLATGAAGGGK